MMEKGDRKRAFSNFLECNPQKTLNGLNSKLVRITPSSSPSSVSETTTSPSCSGEEEKSTRPADSKSASSYNKDKNLNDDDADSVCFSLEQVPPTNQIEESREEEQKQHLSNEPSSVSSTNPLSIWSKDIYTVNDQTLDEYNNKTFHNFTFDEQDDAYDNDDFDEFFESQQITVDEPICKGTNMTLQNSLLLHLAFARRHNLTKAALKDLLHLTSLHLRKPNKFPQSIQQLHASLASQESDITKCFYCKNCYCNIEDKDQVTCDSFGYKEFGHFIINSIENQLSKICKRPGFKECLIKPALNTTSVLKDVGDARTYQELIKQGYFKQDGLNLTCQMNTDGVSLFNSSSFSVWPVYLKINELPPLFRKTKKNRIIAGLWFGYEKPFMRTFLRPIVESLKSLAVEGTSMEYFNGQKEIVRILVIGGLFDLPAKCLVQETVQFNGYFGCSCCEIKGQNVSTSKNGSKIAFPFEEEVK
eukprot:TCONS_00063373-protein